MDTQTINSRPLTITDIKPAIAPLSTFDLPSLIRNMRQSATWKNGEINAMILLNSPEKQILLTALHESTEVESFQASDSVTFQILEGEMVFHTRRESLTLKKGESLTLHEKIKYKLITNQETVFLLTISNDITRAAEN
jgi:hypothetical protein